MNGINTGQQVIDIVTQSDASSHFVPSRFWSYLAYPVTPGDPVVADLAPAYAADRNIANLLTAIFEHPDVHPDRGRCRASSSSRRSTWSVPSVPWAWDRPPCSGRLTAELVPLFAGLGQVLFDPPSVGGWPQNGYWLSTASALARWKFAQRLARAADISMVADAAPAARVDAAAEMLVGPELESATTAAALRGPPATRATVVTLALVSPEFVSN